MSSLREMTDELLIESYLKAIEYKLDPLFISILKAELDYRKINLEKN